MRFKKLLVLTWVLLVLLLIFNQPALAAENINFVITKIDPGVTGKAKEGIPYTAYVSYKLVSEYTSVAGAQIAAFHNNYPAVLKDESGKPVIRATFLPGEEKTFSFTYHPQKISVLKCVIDTPPVENLYRELTEEDNIKHKTVLSEDNQPLPVIPDPTLQLTAISQGGEDVFGNYIAPKQRPIGTAKWGDTITAKLIIPPAPDLGDHYTVEQWKLTSAKVIYPEQHPEFTFGSPVEPIDSIEKDMDIVDNRTAVASFREDWSLNGAGIFDILKGRRIPGATEYPIKVKYVIHWVYTKGEPEYAGDGYTYNFKSYEKNISGRVTANILVNGTGVNSLAH